MGRNPHVSWRRHWQEVIPFFAYPTEVRKIIKTRGHFPNDEAAAKLIYLALRNITKEWKMSAWEWKSAMTQFAILFPERFVQQL